MFALENLTIRSGLTLTYFKRRITEGNLTEKVTL